MKEEKAFSDKIGENINVWIKENENINKKVLKIDTNGFGQNSGSPVIYPWISIMNKTITTSTQNKYPYITIFLNSDKKEKVLYVGLCIGGKEQQVESNLEAVRTIGIDYSKVFNNNLKKGLNDDEIISSFSKEFTNTFAYYFKIEMGNRDPKEFETEFYEKLEMMIAVYDQYALNANKDYELIWEKNPRLKTNSTYINQKSILDSLKSNRQVILQGPPGTGKTRLAKILAYRITHPQDSEVSDEEALINCDAILNKGHNSSEDEDFIKLVQFHPGYGYEDFVIGIDVDTETGDNLQYQVKSKIIKEYADKIIEKNKLNQEQDKVNLMQKYVLIIDEINRAPLSSVLGELLYALEYRGQEIEIPYNQTLIIPDNLLVIGTMNTADKSIDGMDYALRRRFTFIDIKCDEDAKVIDKKLYNLLNSLFQDRYISNGVNPDHIRLGTSYYMTNNDFEKMIYKLSYEIIPLLIEYYKDGVFKRQMRVEELGNSTIEELFRNNGNLLLTIVRKNMEDNA